MTYIYQNKKITYILYGSLLILLSLLLYISCTRRLNFDEALALKSGWLSFNGLKSEPSFFMPITAIWGIIGSVIDDPFYVFMVCRLTVFFSIAIALIWLLKNCQIEWPNRSLFFLLLLLNCVFIIHGIEFRYDAAIMIGLIIGFASTFRLTLDSAIIHGSSIAWLQIHHLKGIYFSVFVLLLAIIFNYRIEYKKKIFIRILTGWSVIIIIWLLFCILTENTRNAMMVYIDFLKLATNSDHKTWPTVLIQTFNRDLAWWLIVVLSALILIITRYQSRRTTLSIAYILVNFIFWLNHPHPWPYMVALIVPFAALIIVDTFDLLKISNIIIIIMVLAIIQFFINEDHNKSIFKTYADLLKSNNTNQIKTLRCLKENISPEDTIIDPTGLSYFVKPLNSQWYSDTLFKNKTERGEWMIDIKPEDIKNCRWMIKSYRLSFLPKEIYKTINQHFIPVCCGLYQSRIKIDKAVNMLQPACSLLNYW